MGGYAARSGVRHDPISGFGEVAWIELVLRLSREASDPWATRNDALQAVEAAVTVAGSEPCECFDKTVLARPTREVVRRCAGDALRVLGSREARIEPYVEVAAASGSADRRLGRKSSNSPPGSARRALLFNSLLYQQRM